MNDTPSSPDTPPTMPDHLPEEYPIKYRTPIWLWVLTVLGIVAVIWMQRPEDATPKERLDAVKGENIEPPGPDPVVIMAKMILGMKQSSPEMGKLLQPMADQFAGWAPANPSLSGGGVSATNRPIPRQEPFPAADRFRTAILAGESFGAEEVGWRLDDVEKDLAADSPLHQDIDTVKKLYGVGSKPTAKDGEELGDDSDAAVHPAVTPVKPEELDPGALEGFKKRHTFFAQLALTRGNDNADFRQTAATQGMLMVLVLMFVFVGVALVGLAGLVLLLVALVNSSKLNAAFVQPDPETEFPAGELNFEGVPSGRGPGSVWLETVCVFVLSFLAIKGVMFGVSKAVGGPAPWMIYLAFALQALTAVTIFWPIARGMTFERWKCEIGWAAPKGVVREMGAGIAAYIAMIPLYFGMAIVVVVMMLIVSALTHSEPPTPAGNKITEIVGSGSPLVLIALFLMATIWAPIVEESIFRGALFRHFRRRVAMPLSALGSALVFAAMHGYVIYGLLMVGTLGFMFAVVREWRGTLVATATIHALHNGIVMLLIATIMSLAAP